MTRKKKTVISPGEPTVLMEGRPAASTGQGSDESVVSGEPTVLVGGRPTAVLRAKATQGRPTVLVNDRPAASQGD